MTNRLPIQRCQYCGCEDIGLGWQHGEALVTFKKHGMLGNRLRYLICRRCGAAIRDPAQIRAYGKQVEAQLADFAQTVKAGSRTELAMLYRLRDMLLSQHAYLTAMADYTAHGGKSRGSALYTDLTGGVKPFAQLPDTFTFALDETEAPLIQELWYEDGVCRTAWRAPRPIPGMTTFLKRLAQLPRDREH